MGTVCEESGMEMEEGVREYGLTLPPLENVRGKRT